jgi:hypothetical protein
MDVLFCNEHIAPVALPPQVSADVVVEVMFKDLVVRRKLAGDINGLGQRAEQAPSPGRRYRRP